MYIFICIITQLSNMANMDYATESIPIIGEAENSNIISILGEADGPVFTYFAGKYSFIMYASILVILAIIVIFVLRRYKKKNRFK